MNQTPTLPCTDRSDRRAVPVADVRRLITETRQRTGWTYHQLAERAGVSRSTIAHLMAERHRLYVQAPVAAAIADVHAAATCRRCAQCDRPTPSPRARYCLPHRSVALGARWREVAA